MTEKEMGILEEAKFETLWDVTRDHDGTLRCGQVPWTSLLNLNCSPFRSLATETRLLESADSLGRLLSVAESSLMWVEISSAKLLVFRLIASQEMGLGKTLSTLALIMWYLDSLDGQIGSPEQSIPRATLIVAPKSSTSSPSWNPFSRMLTCPAIPGWLQQIDRYIISRPISKSCTFF
jgi:hypothetical protein